jgi:prolyl-tRNA synthetase
MSNKLKQQELALSVKKEEDISKWYSELIQKADLIEYTDVSGCMIFRPNSYQIWETIQAFMDIRIKKIGVKNAYFPLFIPEKLLNKEKNHVEGFAPEVAWVDYGGNTKLSQRLAIRPTSETIMYDAYSKWIKSYRDLPLKLNQWCNVVRWEFKHATPFLRNREFLWQEGHTAFEKKEDADKDVREVLEVYRQVYEDLLAIPVTLGRKSEAEKFAGADYSLTAEPFSYSDGKSIQACTSHHLGQKFAKAFEITFLDKNQKKQYVYQNSWGLSTRAIGSLIMIHADNKGLLLPPRLAYNKVVIIPLLFKNKETAVLEKSREIEEKLKSLNPILDDDSKDSAGFKYNKWELQGIPLRIEVGPKDLENNQIIIVRRDIGEKIIFNLDNLNSIEDQIKEILENMHMDIFNNANKKVKEVTIEIDNFDDFKKAIEEKKRCLVPWAENQESEDKIKEITGAKSSCIPFEFEKKSLKGKKCFYSGKDATCWAYFCKSH